jgi:hypothetical protein
MLKRLGQMLAAVVRQKGGKGVRAAHGLLETLKRLKSRQSGSKYRADTLKALLAQRQRAPHAGALAAGADVRVDVFS